MRLYLSATNGSRLVALDTTESGGTVGRGQCPLALTRLFDTDRVAQLANWVLSAEVPAVPVGGDGRDFPYPAFAPGRGSWRGPETLYPTLAGLHGLVGQ